MSEPKTKAKVRPSQALRSALKLIGHLAPAAGIDGEHAAKVSGQLRAKFKAADWQAIRDWCERASEAIAGRSKDGEP